MFGQIREGWRSFAAEWGWPILLGLIIAVGIWTIWYFTKVPCIMARAEAGLCNPGMLASFINADILVKAGGGGLAVGALKGGYDRFMLNKEREARRHAEEQLAEARQEVIATRQEVIEARQEVIATRQEVIEARQEAADARQQAAEARQQAAADAYGMVTELIAEFREERRQNEEERRQSAATQQAMLETMRQLLQQQGANGSSAANDSETPSHD